MASRARDLANLAKGNLTIDASGDLDVSGTVVADGLNMAHTAPIINITDTDTGVDHQINASSGVGNISIRTDVNGEASNGDFFVNTKSNNRLRVLGNGDISFYDNTATTQGFYWDASTQQLGLGTTAPLSLMHLKQTTGNAILKINSDSGERRIDFGDATDNDGGRIKYNSGDEFQFYTNGSEHMRLDSGGKLNVNNTTGSARVNISADNWPENALALYSAGIAGQANFAGMGFFNQDADSPIGQVADIYTNPTGTLSLTASGNPAIQLKYGSHGISGGTPALTVDNAGRIGIATTTPSSGVQLDVRGTGVLQLVNTDNVQLIASNGGSTLKNVSNNPLIFGTNNTERMRIQAAGTVGIGTTAPNANAKLHVSGGRSYFASNSNAFATYLRYNDTTTGVFVGSPAAGQFQVSSSSGASRLNIDSSGNATFSGSVSATGGFVGAGGLPPTMQVFTSSGTWNRPTGCKKIKVTVVGGGGGSGSTTCSGGNCRAGAGGGAGSSIKYIDVTSIASVSVTRGNGGNGGSGSGQGNNGGNGGTSSFGSHCSASGGLGGNKVNSGGTDNVRTSGGFGTGSGGNINIRGYCGGPGVAGGSILFGGGKENGANHGIAGQFGAGGGGSSFGGYNQKNGGAGGAGIIIVEEYY